MKKNFFVAIFLVITLFNTNEAKASINYEMDGTFKWHLNATKTTEMHKKGINGSGIEIYVIDNGIDTTHYEFQDLMAENRLKGDNLGYNVQEKNRKGEYEIADDSHGTSMVSLIAGKTMGIAPKSTIYYHRKSEIGKLNQIKEFKDAIQDAVNKDVDIISMSQAYTLSKEELENKELMDAHRDLQSKIKEAKEQHNILVIAATGNIRKSDCYLNDKNECSSSGNQKDDELEIQKKYPEYSLTVGASDPSIDSVTFPGKFSEVLAVGAVEQTEANHYKRSVNWGNFLEPDTPWTWNASGTGQELDIVSPGTNILAAKNSNFMDFLDKKGQTTKDKILDGDKLIRWNNSYYLKYDGAGTSSATAITAGIAALWKQQYPEMNANELEELLKSTASKKQIEQGDYFDNQYGAGLVQALQTGEEAKNYGVKRDVGLLKNHLTHQFWGISFDYPNTWFSDLDAFDKYAKFYNTEFQMTLNHDDNIDGYKTLNDSGEITWEAGNYYSNIMSSFRRAGVSILEETSYGQSKLLSNGYRLKFAHFKKTEIPINEPFNFTSVYALYTKQGIYTFVLRTDEQHFEEYKLKMDAVLSSTILSTKWMTKMDANSYSKTLYSSLAMTNKNDKYDMNIFNQAVFGLNKNSGNVSDTESALEKQVGAESVQVSRFRYSNGRDSFSNYQNRIETLVSQGKLPMLYFEYDFVQKITSGHYDAQIKEWANGLKNTQAPILVNPIPGYASGYYSYYFENTYQGMDSYYLDEKTFINAYRHIANVFKTEGANNVQFIWDYNKGLSYNYNIFDAARFYPGDDVVNYIGLHGYDKTTYSWNGRKYFDDLFEDKYYDVIRLFPKKPIIISDVGFSESNKTEEKSKFINEMANKLHSKYSNIRLVMWRDDAVIYTEGNNQHVNSSPTSLEAFKNMLQQDYFNTTPIKKLQ